MSELELKPIQAKIVELVEKTVAPGKHSARGAIRHIQRAWLIRDIDHEMAAFRGITGEEESVTAIFHALVRRKYVGADRINRWKHAHKWAVEPFFKAVAQVLAPVQEMLGPKLEVSMHEGEERVRVRIDGLVADHSAYPKPPLNIQMRINSKVHDYKPELQKIAEGHQAGTIKKHIEKLANLRNVLLYAGPTGVPGIADKSLDKHLLGRRDSIFRNLTVFLLIDPYSEKQSFVQDCLDAFLSMMELMPKETTSAPNHSATG